MNDKEKKEYLKGVKTLGSDTKYVYDNPTASILETFPNLNGKFVNNIKIPEYSSLCPKTGQPDFATIWIQYVPNTKCVESKSLKLYMFAYRNYGSFMEDITSKIANDLQSVLDADWIRVTGDFYARGGISIVPVVELGNFPEVGSTIPLPALHSNHQRIE